METIARFFRWLFGLFRPTPDPPPPPPAEWTVYVEVWGEGGQKVPGASIEVDAAADKPHVTGVANFEGNLTLRVPAGLTASHLWARAEGYRDRDQHIDLTDGAHVKVDMVPLSVPLPSVRADGRVFRVGHDIWRYQGVTAFLALKRFLDGDDLHGYLDELRGYGVNILRVLMRVAWGQLDPRRVDGFDDKLHDFLYLLERHALSAELTVLADCRTDGHNIVPVEYWIDEDEQRALLMQVGAVAQEHTNAMVEWGNEHNCNGWSPTLLLARLPFGVLQSRGSGGEEVDPPGPPLDYGTYHPGRDSEWPRKQGKQAAEWSWGAGVKPPGGPFYVPFVDNEPKKIVAGKYDDVLDFYTGHALSCLYPAGSTIHYQSGLDAQLPSKGELPAFRAAAQAWRDIPLDAPLGMYSRGGNAKYPLEHVDIDVDPVRGALRSFGQLFADKAYCVVVRPGPAWTAVARPGWRIVEQRGPRGVVVILERV